MYLLGICVVQYFCWWAYEIHLSWLLYSVLKSMLSQRFDYIPLVVKLYPSHLLSKQFSPLCLSLCFLSVSFTSSQSPPRFSPRIFFVSFFKSSFPSKVMVGCTVGKSKPFSFGWFICLVYGHGDQRHERYSLDCAGAMVPIYDFCLHIFLGSSLKKGNSLELEGPEWTVENHQNVLKHWAATWVRDTVDKREKR